MERIWFTADLHFGHAAMLNLAQRPFENVDAMDAYLIRTWNEYIQPNDQVYILGDVSFLPQIKTLDVLASLNGRKYLLQGNHDKGLFKGRLGKTIATLFEWIKDYHVFKHDGVRAVLSHYPFRSWDMMHHGTWNLHGHSHGTLLPQGRQFDVGVDHARREVGNFAPVSLVYLRGVLSQRAIVSEDHHRPKEWLTALE